MVESQEASTRIFIEQNEIDVFWLAQFIIHLLRNPSTIPKENVLETFKFIQYELKKRYGCSDLQFQDLNKNQVQISDILSQKVKSVQMFLPEKSDIKNKTSVELRAIRDEFTILDNKVTVKKFKQEQKNNEKVTYNIKVLEKLNINSEKSLIKQFEEVYIPKGLDNIDITSKPMTPQFGVAQDNDENDLKIRKKVGGGDGVSQKQLQQSLKSVQQQELRPITPEEVAIHNTENDVWTVYQGKVYDVTNYSKFHPGGIEKLMLGAGMDCTQLVIKYHSWVNVHYLISKYQVGFLIPSQKKDFKKPTENFLKI